MAKLKTVFPYPATDEEKKTPDLKLHNMFSEYGKNIGASTKIRKEKVGIHDANSGKTYSLKAIYGKVTEDKVINEYSDDYLRTDELDNSLTTAEIATVRSNIRKGAKDLNQQWKGALELINKAYQVARVPMPEGDDKLAWSQYEDLIRYAIQQLSKYRGITGNWRLTDLGLPD